jgi:hypothetical protein
MYKEICSFAHDRHRKLTEKQRLVVPAYTECLKRTAVQIFP